MGWLKGFLKTRSDKIERWQQAPTVRLNKYTDMSGYIRENCEILLAPIGRLRRRKQNIRL